ncbi:lipid-A-disaccharide synthase [Plastoroseomonas arctica]|uniref:Lipid-A-disaccharide synthase n=1 Tax=Plastoroseomonas arctica TaxID=1509237 RepID=A0AAF1K499_9PROT|nr:lipid-A-disaccharide synthase [Plastoroseomonas arctica]MBR0655986.1 lipid-A-disaccharide synthase [Plastoroseomonas arctica]
MPLIYILAGEASGDVLGARLLPALRARRPDLAFAGIGGPRLAEQGLASLFDYRELALMGLVEILPNIARLTRRLSETTADIAAREPDLILTIDSPGFAFRIAKRVRPLGIPLIHYVAPQVWAWRQGRVKKLKPLLDGILALLPFEAPFFEKAGIPVTFVGHPVLESGADHGDAARFAERFGLAPTDTPVLVMPGSRRGEVQRLLPVFGPALALLANAHPTIRPVIAVAPITAAQVRAAAAGWPNAPILVEALDDKHDAFAATAARGGAGLIKSGTSSLEMAVAGVPHVVAYKVNPVTAAIVRRIVKVKYASLVNLLADAPVAPEFLQEFCTPESLSGALSAILASPGSQREGFAHALARLRAPEGLPSEAAAIAVLRALDGLQRVEKPKFPEGVA